MQGKLNSNDQMGIIMKIDQAQNEAALFKDIDTLEELQRERDAARAQVAASIPDSRARSDAERELRLTEETIVICDIDFILHRLVYSDRSAPSELDERYEFFRDAAHHHYVVGTRIVDDAHSLFRRINHQQGGVNTKYVNGIKHILDSLVITNACRAGLIYADERQPRAFPLSYYREFERRRERHTERVLVRLRHVIEDMKAIANRDGVPIPHFPKKYAERLIASVTEVERLD